MKKVLSLICVTAFVCLAMFTSCKNDDWFIIRPTGSERADTPLKVCNITGDDVKDDATGETTRKVFIDVENIYHDATVSNGISYCSGV